jgi:hypothetical protein
VFVTHLWPFFEASATLSDGADVAAAAVAAAGAFDDGRAVPLRVVRGRSATVSWCDGIGDWRRVVVGAKTLLAQRCDNVG